MIQPKLPHEMLFAEFAKVASVKTLVNHGRQSQVFFGETNLGFCDSKNIDDALRQAHKREVNNALYSNLIDKGQVLPLCSMPPVEVVKEYPDLKTDFSRDSNGVPFYDTVKVSSESYRALLDNAVLGKYFCEGAVSPKTYHGTILAESNLHVAQKTSRGIVTIHHKHNLDGIVKVGECPSLKYDHGYAKVIVQQKESVLENQR